MSVYTGNSPALTMLCNSQVATAYPNLFFSKEGACDQPLQPLHPHHKHLAPVRDTQIRFVRIHPGKSQTNTSTVV